MGEVKQKQEWMQYLEHFMEEFSYPEEAREELSRVLNIISQKEEDIALIEKLLKGYEKDCNCDYGYVQECCEKLAKENKVNRYTVDLLIFILFSKHLKTLYKQAGIKEEIWHDSMCDLKYKLLECKAVKNVWGSFVAYPWFTGFFRLKLFTLGRLQFELQNFRDECYEEIADDGGKDGKGSEKRVKKNESVINVHIPRTLTPLTPESCDEAFQMAAKFFAKEFQDRPVTFVCYSWLLYPELIKLLSEKSNVRKFAERFHIIEVEEDPCGQRPNMWRLFDMDEPKDLNDYPEDTSLRRIVKKYLLDGGTMGEGYGVFFYE